MRNDALARIKVAFDSLGTVKTNVAKKKKRWDALCKAGHVAETSAPPEMSAWARQFKDTLSKLKHDMKKDVSTWTLSSAPAHLEKKKVILTISELDQVATSMAVQVKAIEDRIAQRHKSRESNHTQRANGTCQASGTLAQFGGASRRARASVLLAIHARVWFARRWTWHADRLHNGRLPR
jgi:hypothetical protein